MLLLYSVTIFLSATLLFLVQPMFAKMVLPMLGGTPAVWNTCMVFFQAMLLAGYAYAHATCRLLGVRKQAMLHSILLVLPLAVLPIAVAEGWNPPTEGNPTGWLLLLLAVSVGLPFFVVSTSNPLLQQWFAGTGHPAAKDPYFLYAASNAGSMLSLLAYPILLEPQLTLETQSTYWAYGYGALIVAILGCASLLWKNSQGPQEQMTLATDAESAAGPRFELSAQVGFGRRMRWIALSFVPSSLMLGVTTYLTSDVASVPLFWIVPLALYLLTFILVFASRPPIKHEWVVAALPWFVLPIALSMFSLDIGLAMMILVPLTFFVLAMACHGELARDRPSTKYLTEFYLWMSVGGVLGGIFNALLAPVLFNSVAEYPIAIALACMLCGKPQSKPSTPRDRLFDLALPAALFALLMVLSRTFLQTTNPSLQAKLGVFLIPALLCFSFKDRPVRFGLGIAAILFAGQMTTSLQHKVLFAERSFFGIHRVLMDKDETFHELQHGTTFHGRQSLADERRCVPASYYHPTGPFGDVFRKIGGDPEVKAISIVGLGAGGMMAFSQPGQKFTYYEIDPTVRKIAEDPELFGYLKGCAKGTYEIVMGDGRHRLKEAPEGSYHLMMFDAFSSDSIPIHLVTREAMEMYLTKLAPGGVIAVHISNRYMDLEPVLAALAEELNLVCYIRSDRDELTEEQRREGKAFARVVVMARSMDDLRGLEAEQGWQPAQKWDGVPVWTDNFSNILEIMLW